MSSYHHRYSQPSTQSQAQVLETEFPLMGLPPITNPGSQRISRTSSRDRAGLANSSSLGRGAGNTQQNYSSSFGRKVSNTSASNYTPSPAHPPSYSSATAAPEWQYEAVSTIGSGRGNGSMSKIQTSFQPTPQRPIPISMKIGGASMQTGRTTSLNRSSSLRRAYSDACSSSSGEPDPRDINPPPGIEDRLPSPGDITDNDNVPLHPKGVSHGSRIPHIVQSSSGGDGSATSDYHSDSVTVGLKSSHNTTPSDNYHESAKPLLAIHHHPDNVHSLRMQGQFRHRRVDEDSMTLGAKCCFTFLMLITQILLHGVVGLVLYWVWMFHKGDDPKSWHPFAWRENPRKEFNLHPVLMIVGFVYCMGQAMLMYRSCRCCRRIANKLLHTVFHLLAMPCIAIAFVATYDSHTNRTVPCEQGECPAPIPNFYSLHSWMGLTTMGLFAMQFIVGFFSFLLLLCCESATASFRANLVPIHSTFGITTFVMAIATCCSGLTEKAFFTLSIGYKEWVRFAAYPSLWSTEDQDEEYTAEMFSESIVINTLGACLIALMFTVPILLLYPKFRYRPQRIITVTTHHKGTHDRYA